MDIRKGLELMDEMDQKNRQAVEAHKAKIHGMLVDVDAGTVEPVDAGTELQDLYDLLRCDCIDIVEVIIDGFPYAAVCDDEGLFKDCPRTAVTGTGFKLVGNVLLCQDSYEDGELVSLTAQDIQRIREHVKVAGRRAKNRRARMEIWHYIEAD